MTVLGLLGVAMPELTIWVFDGNLREMPEHSAVFLSVLFVVTFIVWSFYGVAFYAVSSVFEAEGSLCDTVVLAG